MKSYTNSLDLLNGEEVKSVKRLEEDTFVIEVQFESGHRWLRSDVELLDYITHPGVTNHDNAEKIAAVIEV